MRPAAIQSGISGGWTPTGSIGNNKKQHDLEKGAKKEPERVFRL
jgi:hypothetical protein